MPSAVLFRTARLHNSSNLGGHPISINISVQVQFNLKYSAPRPYTVVALTISSTMAADAQVLEARGGDNQLGGRERMISTTILGILSGLPRD